MIKKSALVLSIGILVLSLAIASAGKARPQVGEKQDSAVTPNAATGPRPRNETDEIYRGPPSNWDEGRVIVDVDDSTPKGKHPDKSNSEKK